ncbi:NLR [Porites harrisoni]
MSEASKKVCNCNLKDSDTGPPQLAVHLPSRKDVTTTLKQPDLPVDVLLLTVKDCEFLSCYNGLKDPYRYYYKDVGYVYFNNVQSHEEKVKVALLRCSEGAIGPSSSLIAVKNAVPILQPKAVISVGVCSGLNPDKTKLGDVVVSAKLTTYGSKVVTSEQDQWAGMSSHVSKLFSKIILNCADGWQAPLKNPEDRQVKVHCDGEFLSGPEQIRAQWRRKELIDRHPLAAGVEMEGEGVFTAAFDSQLEWLIVKGIADFADGEQATAESWETCASMMAASLVSHILSDPCVFRTWPHYSVDGLFEAEHDSARKRKLVENHAGALCDDQISQQTKRGMYSDHLSQQNESITQQHLAGVPAIIERIRQLYKRREGRLVPFPWCDDLNFNLNEIFTRLKIVNKEKTRGTLTDDEITNMTAIFRPHPDCPKPRILLIEGEPGMGKTTYSQKLAYDWANKQDEWDTSFPSIEVLLLLRCNDVKSGIWEAIDDQLLPDDIDEQAKENFFKYIRENQAKCLLLLDGLDEADSFKLDMYYSLVQSKLLPACHIVITSRHEVGKKVRPYCDALWEIVRFTSEDAESFIRKYFKGKEHLAEQLIERLKLPEYDDDDDDDPLSTLGELTKNPLNTALLCCLFEDFEGVLPTSRTELYVEIVAFVLRRYEVKNGLKSSGEDLISGYKKELLLLGSFALESLLKGELYFEKKEDTVKLINFGFLSFQQGAAKRKPCTRCAFLHKSFQEFFAGLFLAFQSISKERDFTSVVDDKRYLDKLRQVFLFMSGIMALRSEETAMSFFIVIAKQISSAEDRKSYMSLACECLLECSSVQDSLETRLVSSLGNHLDMSSLTKVDFARTGIHAAGAAAISMALTVNSSLTSLDLRFNRIGDAGASSLSQALTTNTSLTSLYLGGNGIRDAGASSLSQALTTNTSLTSLYLDGNSIGEAGASSLSQALTTNTSLTSLYLGYNSIGDAGASSLSQALTVNSSLTSLDLGGNRIGEAGASSLSQALTTNTSLTSLYLGGNGIRDAGASSLSQALTTNTSLTSLDLSDNSIGEAGASSLSQALTTNTSLTSLDLSVNSIGDAGASSLSQALTTNTSLTSLYLLGNSIGDAGASSLSQALTTNTSLTSLHLGGNSIGDAGASSLSQALTTNTSLTSLYLRGNSIGEAGASSLSQALTANSSLKNLFF